MNALQTLLLVTALSVDAFVASFAYGTDRIRIPPRSVMVLNFVCTGILAGALVLGSLAGTVVSERLARGLSFAILFLLGVTKLCESSIKALIQRHQKLHKRFRFSLFSVSFILSVYADPQSADRDESHDLSPVEAASLAVALSLDGLAVGFGAGMSGASILQTALLSLLMGVGAVMSGCRLGNCLAERGGPDFSWLGGVLLILLAVLRYL